MAWLIGELRKIDWDLAGLVGVMMALCGLVVAAAMLVLFNVAITDEVSTPNFVIAATVGAGIAGGATHGCFGHGGFWGAQKFLVGMVAATSLGGGIAGLMVLSADDLMLVVLALMFAALSPITLVWVVVMALIQARTFAIRQRKAERVQTAGPSRIT